MRVLLVSPLSLLLLLRATSNTNAFTTGFCSLAVPSGIGETSLFGKWAENDDYDSSSSSSSNPPRDALSRNRARTDVRNFLTQRAIQSFVFLLAQCRDGHTASWIEVRLPRPKRLGLVCSLPLEDVFSLTLTCFPYCCHCSVGGSGMQKHGKLSWNGRVQHYQISRMGFDFE